MNLGAHNLNEGPLGLHPTLALGCPCIIMVPHTSGRLGGSWVCRCPRMSTHVHACPICLPMVLGALVGFHPPSPSYPWGNGPQRWALLNKRLWCPQTASIVPRHGGILGHPRGQGC